MAAKDPGAVLAECVALLDEGRLGEAFSWFRELDFDALDKASQSEAGQLGARLLAALTAADDMTLVEYARAMAQGVLDATLKLADDDPTAGLTGLDALLTMISGVAGLEETVACAVYNRAAALRALHRFDEAAEAYEHAVDRYAGYPDIEIRFWVALSLYNHATLLLDLEHEHALEREHVDDGAVRRALQLLDRLLTEFADSPHPGIRDQVARAAATKVLTLFRLGRSDEAAQVFAELQAVFANDPSEIRAQLEGLAAFFPIPPGRLPGSSFLFH